MLLRVHESRIAWLLKGLIKYLTDIELSEDPAGPLKWGDKSVTILGSLSTRKAEAPDHKKFRPVWNLIHMLFW